MFGIPGFLASSELNVRLSPKPAASDEFRDSEHWSAYAMVEYDITEQLTASLEARYSDETLNVGWIVGGRGANGFVPPPFFFPGAGAPTGITVGTYEVRRTI